MLVLEQHIATLLAVIRSLIHGPNKIITRKNCRKTFGVSKDTDLSLRGDVQSSRVVVPPFEASGGTTNLT